MAKRKRGKARAHCKVPKTLRKKMAKACWAKLKGKKGSFKSKAKKAGACLHAKVAAAKRGAAKR